MKRKLLLPLFSILLPLACDDQIAEPIQKVPVASRVSPLEPFVTARGAVSELAADPAGFYFFVEASGTWTANVGQILRAALYPTDDLPRVLAGASLSAGDPRLYVLGQVTLRTAAKRCDLSLTAPLGECLLGETLTASATDGYAMLPRLAIAPSKLVWVEEARAYDLPPDSPKVVVRTWARSDGTSATYALDLEAGSVHGVVADDDDAFVVGPCPASVRAGWASGVTRVSLRAESGSPSCSPVAVYGSPLALTADKVVISSQAGLSALDRVTGEATSLWSAKEAHEWAEAAAVDGSTLYVLAGASEPTDGPSRWSLRRISLGGGAVTSLDGEGARRLYARLAELDGPLNPPQGQIQLAAGGGYLYVVTSLDPNRIYQIAESGDL